MTISIFNGDKGAGDDQEDLLAMPTKDEVGDQALHVERCGYRYLLLRRNQRQQARSLSTVQLLVGVAIFVEVVSGGIGQKVWGWIFGV